MTSRLVLPVAEAMRIRRHAARAYPEECCGILVGREGSPESGAVRVERLVEAENVAPHGRRRHYAIAPELLLATHRAVREDGHEVVGYYHSHPDQPPRPSSTDHRYAWPGVSYLIVSVIDGEAGEMASWRLSSDGKGFVEESRP